MRTGVARKRIDIEEYRESLKAKIRNFENLKLAHKQMGYDLLMNEHRFIELGGEKIAILGNETPNESLHASLPYIWNTSSPI